MTNTHKLYDQCKYAHYNTSFSPEKRAEAELSMFDAQIAEFKALCGDDTERFNDLSKKYESKFVAHMAAKARCASTMITGGGNFNVARNEKRLAAERSHSDKLEEFINKVRLRFHREANLKAGQRLLETNFCTQIFKIGLIL